MHAQWVDAVVQPVPVMADEEIDVVECSWRQEHFKRDLLVEDDRVGIKPPYPLGALAGALGEFAEEVGEDVSWFRPDVREDGGAQDVQRVVVEFGVREVCG